LLSLLLFFLVFSLPDSTQRNSIKEEAASKSSSAASAASASAEEKQEGEGGHSRGG
jgi:hypothetical protein